MKNHWKKRILAATAVVGLNATAFGSTFIPGNIAVYRVGDGTQTLANTGNSVFVDEYNPLTGTLVQSVALPTTATGANHALVASGTATSEGLLTTSADGRYLLMTGYDSSIPAAASLTSSTVSRVIGRIDWSGAVDTTTALTDYATGNNPRSAVSTDGTNIWVTGAAGGIRYTTLGSTTSTQLSTTVTNLRQANIQGGQLYVSDSSGSAVRIGAVGTGTPTTSGQTITNLPGFTTTGSPYGFVFADLTDTVAGFDTLYVADDSGSGTTATAGIQKYSLVNGSWTLNGTVAGTGFARGLIGAADGASESLFATLNGSSLVSYVDSAGYNAAPSANAPILLATAGTNEAFRGIAFSPVNTPEPTGVGCLLTLTGLLSLRRRRGQR